MIRYKDEILAVELSSYCNLKCPMCTQSRVDYGKKGFLSLDLWKKIIDDFEMNNTYHEKFLPFGLGESLMHPHSYEIFKYLFEKNKNRTIFGYIILHTNALLMDKKISDLFLEYQYQIGAFHFSLDASTQEIYKKVRPGGKLQTAINNIIYFLRKRAQIPPKLIFQFIVMKNNVLDAENFLNFWSKVLKDHKLSFQVNYDWEPEMIKDTIFFKRENTWDVSHLNESEERHKELAVNLGLIEPTKGRILKSDEYIR